MKKILLTVTGFIAVAMLFTGVGYAAATWLNFTGDEQIKQSESDVDEIMQILRDTHDGKLDAEKAYAELEAMNPKELVDKIKTLEKDLGDKDKIIADHVIVTEQLKQDKAQLTTDLAAANKAKTDAENAKTDAENALAGKQEELNNKQTEIKQKEQEIQQKIEEGNSKVAEKQAELDGVAKQRDEHKRVAEELQQQINQNNKHVEHLESELKRANETVAEYGKTTQEAVEEARTYK